MEEQTAIKIDGSHLGNVNRRKGDALGRRGLPGDRAALDAMLAALCERLRTAGAVGIRGEQLAAEMALDKGTRALRALVAYGQVHHHIHQIIGVPGKGYYWGPAVDGLAARMIRSAERYGRDYLYKAALLKREGLAMAAVQQVFSFVEHAGPRPGGFDDDLAALAASEGVTVTDVLETFVARLRESDAGRAALAAVADKHADVLITAAVAKRLAAKLDDVKNDFLTAFARALAS